jgi:hypothetical protein
LAALFLTARSGEMFVRASEFDNEFILSASYYPASSVGYSCERPLLCICRSRAISKASISLRRKRTDLPSRIGVNAFVPHFRA